MITAKTLSDADLLKDKKNLNQVFDLDSAYTQYVMTEKRDDRSGVFHPSAVGMCGRRNVYEYLGYETSDQLDEEDLEIFRIGHQVHELVQKNIHNIGNMLADEGIIFQFEDEVPYSQSEDFLYHEAGIGGTCDGVIDVYKPNEWHQRGVLEVKSIKDDNWKSLTSPKHDHRMQANLYAYRFDAPIIWYWYYNKNNSLRKVFTEPFNEEVFNEAVLRFQHLLDYALKRELPEREESWYMCPRCSYNHHCQPSIIRSISNKQNDKMRKSARDRMTKNRSKKA